METTAAKTFPITQRTTGVAVIILTGLVTLIYAGGDLRRGHVAEWFGHWTGAVIFVAAVPGLLAYIAGGRRKDWARNDRWFFTGCFVLFLFYLGSAVHAAH